MPMPLPPGTLPPPPDLPPPPVDLAARRAAKQPEATGPELPEQEPAPEDWEPEDLDDITGKDYAWKSAPTHEEVCQLAQDVLDDPFWQERNQACYLQSRCYYRSKHWWKLDGRPFSDIEGDLIYMLSGPAKQVDRMVARCKVDLDHLVFQLPERSEREEYKTARDNVENWYRDRWGKFITEDFDSLAQRGPNASLIRKLPFLDTLHGAVGYSLRANTKRRKGTKRRDINADKPLLLDIIPQHELYQLGDCTLRIQSVTLKEARRMSAEVREKWPSRKEADREKGKWYPEDDHRCRMIAFSDVAGRWYAQCFDLAVGDKRPKGMEEEDDDRFWTVKPQQMNYGRCIFQLPPGWQSTGDNALPDERQAAENFGQQFARGALFVNLHDFFMQDQSASRAAATYMYNGDPSMVETVDAQSRTALGEKMPEPMQYGRGGRNTRWKDEGAGPILRHHADTPSDQFFLSMIYGQTADTYPAALGGGGDAQSGYDRRQMVENAQVLHVQEIRDHVAMIVAMIGRHALELMYRLGSGDKKVFGELPFRRSRGGVGEGTLTVEDIEKAGIAVTVAYHEDDDERDLRLNSIVIPRVKEKLISLERGREMIGEPEPALEETRIDEEMAMSHPAMQEVRAIAALLKRPQWLPFLLEALHRNAQGQKINEPGMPSLPGSGGEGPGVTPQPGIPAGGAPPAAQGMPPGMRMPPGVGV